jgi:cytochrome c5
VTLKLRAKVVLGVAALLVTMMSARATSDEASDKLAAPESFSTIADSAARSAALFTEAGKVLTHPRCVNCHPAGDRPRQGDVRRLHQPPVARGEDGFGLPSMRCPICHQAANFEPAGVPGNPAWHLAPHEMAWEGKTLAQICEQIKDPARNGGRSLEEIVHHVGEDHLVAWAWAPGGDRRPAPGTQAQAGALLDAWVKTGAVCPN